MNLIDRIDFIGMQIWDFSLLSLNREYSWLFLFNIIFKYPLKSLKGFLAYKNFSRSLDSIFPQQIYVSNSIDEFMKHAKADRNSLLVAMGYCQRPLKSKDQNLICPSKRFSHDCYFIENSHRIIQFPSACSICDIMPIAKSAIQAGTSFYIMTSAIDIARDIFIPSLKTQRFKYAIMFICPYSILPITLPLFICDIKFIIIPYTTGACCSYGDFVRADMGMKPKRTFASRENFKLALTILQALKVKQKN